MGVDDVARLTRRGAEGNQHCGLVDEVGSVCAENVGPDDAAARFLGDYFAPAVGLAGRYRLAVGAVTTPTRTRSTRPTPWHR